MAENCCSTMVGETERILGFEPGDFQKYFRCIPWDGPAFCKRLDESGKSFSSIHRERYDLKKTRLNYYRCEDEKLDMEIFELFDAIGFMFSLLLYFEKNARDSTKNFAERCPDGFEAWIAERENGVRRSNLRAVK